MLEIIIKSNEKVHEKHKWWYYLAFTKPALPRDTISPTHYQAQTLTQFCTHIAVAMQTFRHKQRNFVHSFIIG